MLRPALLGATTIATIVLVGARAGQAQTRTWSGESAVIVSNALAGGLTAGIRQALSGGSFEKGFLWGAAGGTVGYLGKRVATTRIDGAGFLGREIAAVGHSMVRNASDGRPVLSRLYLPLGPIPAWVTFVPNGESAARVRVDAVSLGRLVALAADSDLRFDAARTASLGAPVFEALRRHVVGPGNDPVFGVMSSGNIVISDRRTFYSVVEVDRTLSHETVHVIQRDFMFAVWSDPANQFLLDAIGLGIVNRYIMLNQAAWVGFALGDWLPNAGRSRSPFELEAEWLER